MAHAKAKKNKMQLIIGREEEDQCCPSQVFIYILRNGMEVAAVWLLLLSTLL